jgi:hypothetical protein
VLERAQEAYLRWMTMIMSLDLQAKEERKPQRKRYNPLLLQNNPRRKELRVKIKQKRKLKATPRQLPKRIISD